MASDWPFEGSFGKPTTSGELQAEDFEDEHYTGDLVSRTLPPLSYYAREEMEYTAGEAHHAMEIARTADQLLATFDNVRPTSSNEEPTIDPSLLQLDTTSLSFNPNALKSTSQSQLFDPTFADNAHPFEHPEMTTRVAYPYYHHMEADPISIDTFNNAADVFDFMRQRAARGDGEVAVINNAVPHSGNADNALRETEGLTISRTIVGDGAAHYELHKLLENGLLLGGTADGFAEAMKRAVASLQSSGDFPDEAWSNGVIDRIRSDGEEDLKEFLQATAVKYNDDNKGRKSTVSYGVIRYHHGSQDQDDCIELYALRKPTHCFCIELWPRDEAYSDPDDQEDQEEDRTARSTPLGNTNTESATTSKSRLTRAGKRLQGIKRPSVKTSYRLLQHIGMPIQYWLNKKPSEVREMIVAGDITPDEVTGEVAFTLAKGYTNSECAELIGIARDTFYNGRVLKYMQARSAQAGAPTLAEIQDSLDKARRENKIRVGRR